MAETAIDRCEDIRMGEFLYGSVRVAGSTLHVIMDGIPEHLVIDIHGNGLSPPGGCQGIVFMAEQAIFIGLRI
jgi:hypothetical protein